MVTDTHSTTPKDITNMTLTTETQLTRSDLQDALRYYRNESTVLVNVKLSAKTSELQVEYDRIQNHIATLNSHYDITEAKESTIEHTTWEVEQTVTTNSQYSDITIHERVLPSDMLQYRYLAFLSEPFINCLGKRVETSYVPPYTMPFSEYVQKWIDYAGSSSIGCLSYDYHQSAIAKGITQDVNNGQHSKLTCSTLTYAEDPTGICRQYVIGKSEADAYQLGNSPSALLQRLKDARSCLNDYLAKRFKTYTYDFTNKRLVSNCKNFHLQWKLRANPDQPESYGNQQTSRGTVICLDAKPKHNIRGEYTTV